jgi:hypothetical protein
MCADSWTNFNEAEPGLMILEQVLYASTELSYRASLPMERLLSDSSGKIAWNENSLYSPIDVLPMEPLTSVDYVRLLYDRVPGLVYAWSGPLDSRDQGASPGVSGRLQARVAVAPDAGAGAGEEALLRARSVLARHRNLGERFESVTLQPFVHFGMDITLHLAPGATGEIVWSNLYLAVKQALLAGPQFLSLEKALVDSSTDAALCGPQLSRGLLAETDLPGLWWWTEARERAAQAILRVPWVQAVNSITFPDEAEVIAQSRSAQQLYAPSLVTTVTPLSSTDSGPRAGAGFRVSFGAAPALRLGAGVQGWGSGDARANMFIQAGGDTPSVQFGRLLPSEKWTMPSVPDLPTTAVGEYHSVQHSFPQCFLLHADSLPPPSEPLRRAQVLQLKGYLLVFEQLMANFLAQLANTSAFFSNLPQTRTVFTQPLASVPEVMQLLPGTGDHDYDRDPAESRAHEAAYWADPGNPYVAGLHAIAENADDRQRRRDRVLDHLLSRFNESFPRTDHTTYETIANKENLLQAYPRIGRRRAAAAELTGRPGPGTVRPRSGLEEKIQILLRRDTQSEPEADRDDFYHVFESIVFLPRADATGAGERWNLPLDAFAPCLFHVFVNWTLRPLTGAFVSYCEALVAENAPAHLLARHIWLETRPAPEANVGGFRALFQAWANAGFPQLILASARRASDPPLPDRTIDVCRGTSAANLFAWLLDPSSPAAGPAFV